MELPVFEPSVETLQRLALALAVGLFVGMEREHNRKEAGLRTFAFVAVLGALGGILGGVYAVLALIFVGILVILLAVQTLKSGEGAEITTAAAMFITAFTGVLSGLGLPIPTAALAVMTAALLAWKRPLAGFSRTLSEIEVRSAIMLAMLAFVVYPILPVGSVDPWGLIVPRSAWITVILMAALGFVNYVLLKLYSDRGLLITGFLGGLVNSKLASIELATRANNMNEKGVDAAYRGIILTNGAMVVRNLVVLIILAPVAVIGMISPLIVMLAIVGVVVFSEHIPSGMLRSLVTHEPRRKREPGVDEWARSRTGEGTGEVERGVAVEGGDMVLPAEEVQETPAKEVQETPAEESLGEIPSPFSVSSAIKFGIMFLIIQVVSTIALRELGEGGLYAVAILGGIISSVGAVASIANLAAQSEVTAQVAALGVVMTSVSSLLFCIPFVGKFGKNRYLTRRVTFTILMMAGVGIIISVAQVLIGGLK